MKKLLIILIISCLVVAARAENIVSVSSASGHPQDEVTLNVSLANTDEAVAFQADIPLGSQLTYVEGSVALNSERTTNHVVTAAVVNGTLKILVYSVTLSPFVGSEGNLLSFTLRLKNEPGDYPITLTNAILSNASGEPLPLVLSVPSVPSPKVTILSPKLQINTLTLNYGHVPIWSEYTQTAQVSNVGNEPLTITSVTFSDAVFSCPSFTETTLQAGESTNFTFKFAPMVKGAVTATATMVSNSISGNGIINLVADPFAVNEIHIGNTMGYCDSIVEVPITMNNMEGIIGFQIEFTLNSALEFVDFTLSDRKTNHVATGVVSGTILRLMAYSPSGAAFTGDDGLIGTVRFLLKGMYGYYYLNPTKAVLADANGEDVLSAKYQGYVNIRSPKINGNSSLSFGSTPVTETVIKEYVVYNNGNAQMRIDQIVFDQSDFAVAENFPITVGEWESTVLHVSYSREQKGDFNALMKIYSNDPQNGLKNVALSGSRYEPNSLELSAEVLETETVEVSLTMHNYSDIVALQANFRYPHENFSVQAADFQLTERFSNHFLYATPTNDSTYRIIVLSMQNSTVEDHEGAVLNITLHPIGIPEAKQYTVSVSDIVLSGAEGTNLFTGEFDPCVSHFFLMPVDFHFTTAGTWSKTSNWQYNTLPRDCDRVFIDAPCQLDQNATVAALTVSNGQSLTLQSGKILTVTGNLTNTATTSLVIEDSTQLVHNVANVQATVKKHITPFNGTDDDWHLIALPLTGSIDVDSVVNLLEGEYDLYGYDETTTSWKNQKATGGFTALEAAKGYLYGNNAEVTLEFSGTLQNSSDTISVPLSYTDGVHLSGFNLVGNPFPCNAYLNKPYYVLDENGTGINPNAIPITTPIPPCTAVFVKAEATGETVVFTRVAP
jgi:hypothetical protein